MIISYAGEPGAFSELAAVEYCGTRATAAPVPDFDAVFRAVSARRADMGIVPIENSLAGSIHQNYDLLLEHRLYITGEISLRIAHYLIANKGAAIGDIRRIYSHPQALAQCKKHLRSFRRAEIIPVSSTAGAVKKIRDERMLDAAAIGSLQAVMDYKMAVLARNIEDNELNTTRFIVLSRTPIARAARSPAPAKTSILFSTKNAPGALFRALSVFALRDINLLKIESRPVMTGKFEYRFYLDFSGNHWEERQKNALNHLREITSLYRLLGSYPVGRDVLPEYRKR
jgi:prephenate dehydratase